MNATASTIKILRIIIRLKKILEKLNTHKRVTYVDDRVLFYKSMWQRAAAKLGVEFNMLSDAFWEVGNHANKIRLNNYKVPIDDPVVLSLAGEKDLCHKLLSQKGLPVPEYAVFNLHELEKGIAFFKNSTGPFVVKPSSGTSGGRGVSVLVETYPDFLWSVALASLCGERIIIERMVIGELYRLLFLEKRLINASRRSGLSVTGDGQSSLFQLMLDNPDTNKEGTVDRDGRRIKKDKDIRFTLAAQGLAMDIVPNAGEKILVKSFPSELKSHREANSSYNQDVTDLVCPDIIDAARTAVDHLGIRFAGLDLITTNPSVPLEKTGGAIIEVNTTPGLHHHYNLEGHSNGNQPAELVLQYLLMTNERECKRLQSHLRSRDIEENERC